MAGRDSQSLVSVIIPTYNRSQLLRLTVESVLAQTYPNVEIIVVDDGSTDDTAAVMAQYAGQVTYIQRPHVGSGGRNVGLGAASGEYINFLDHDDLMLSTKIERQVQVLDARPEIGLVHCGYYHIDRDGNLLEKVCPLLEEDLRQLVCASPIWSGAPLIRRQCLERVGGFDEDMFVSDTDMWFRIARAGYQFACIQEPLGAYRILPDSEMADVAKLEQGTFAFLDKVFADPHLSADVVAVKGQAYGGIHLWISWRYYAAGRWDDAQRNLMEALTLRPQLLEHPKHLSQHLCDHALGVRVSDPVRFVSDVFSHLPSGADALCRYRLETLGDIHVGLALKNYCVGDIAEAKRQLAEAIALNPAILEGMEGFAESLCRYAMRLPLDSPLAYADTVLQNLPPGAQRLKRTRPHVLSEVSLGCAFEKYYAGRRQLVPRHVLTALRYRPSWLTNRGALSILLKSLAEFLTTQSHQIA